MKRGHFRALGTQSSALRRPGGEKEPSVLKGQRKAQETGRKPVRRDRGAGMGQNKLGHVTLWF